MNTFIDFAKATEINYPDYKVFNFGAKGIA